MGSCFFILYLPIYADPKTPAGRLPDYPDNCSGRTCVRPLFYVGRSGLVPLPAALASCFILLSFCDKEKEINNLDIREHACRC